VDISCKPCLGCISWVYARKHRKGHVVESTLCQEGHLGYARMFELAWSIRHITVLGGDPDLSNCRPPGEHRSGAAQMSNV
jgi:hypothetical protein